MITRQVRCKKCGEMFPLTYPEKLSDIGRDVISYQAQYDYYKAGNTKIANNHTAVTTAVWWWLRSPFYYITNYFVIVWTDGGNINNTAYYSGGLRPGFAA